MVHKELTMTVSEAGGRLNWESMVHQAHCSHVTLLPRYQLQVVPMSLPDFKDPRVNPEYLDAKKLGTWC